MMLPDPSADDVSLDSTSTGRAVDGDTSSGGGTASCNGSILLSSDPCLKPSHQQSAQKKGLRRTVSFEASPFQYSKWRRHVRRHGSFNRSCGGGGGGTRRSSVRGVVVGAVVPGARRRLSHHHVALISPLCQKAEIHPIVDEQTIDQRWDNGCSKSTVNKPSAAAERSGLIDEEEPYEHHKYRDDDCCGNGSTAETAATSSATIFLESRPSVLRIRSRERLRDHHHDGGYETTTSDESTVELDLEDDMYSDYAGGFTSEDSTENFGEWYTDDEEGEEEDFDDNPLDYASFLAQLTEKERQLLGTDGL